MKQSLRFLSTFLFCLISFSSYAQDNFTLSGTIIDSGSNETLIGVNIIFPELQTGTMTNEYGFYSITLPEGTYNIIISYIGFANIEETLILSENIVKELNK